MGTGYLMPRASLFPATTGRRVRTRGASADGGTPKGYAYPLGSEGFAGPG